MSIFRASFRDEAKAFLVDLFHVVPPQVLLSLVGDDIMDARLSQVFVDDILSINSMEIIFDVVLNMCLQFLVFPLMFILEGYR